MISWTWINSIFWSVAPLLGWSRISYEPSKISCTVDLMNPDAGYRSYIILCFVFCYIFPLLAFSYFIANKSMSKSLSPTTGRKVVIVCFFFFFSTFNWLKEFIWILIIEENCQSDNSLFDWMDTLLDRISVAFDRRSRKHFNTLISRSPSVCKISRIDNTVIVQRRIQVG